jgi:WD40 repeat protein
MSAQNPGGLDLRRLRVVARGAAQLPKPDAGEDTQAGAGVQRGSGVPDEHTLPESQGAHPAGTPEQPPDRIGRYRVLKQVGEGGMGVVYAAYDNDLDRKIAVKLLGRARGPAAIDRLRREAQALARLSHPHVIAVHDVGEHDRRVFVAMEFVGQTLREWSAEQKRSWREILELYQQVGRGLAAAHEVGIVHRDLKPANVLVGEDGRARVADFGLARAVGEPEPAATGDAGASASSSALHSQLTPADGVLGTYHYMSPEQFRAPTVGPKADQFSFCVAMYESLYGERPFGRGSPAALQKAIEAGQVRAAPRGVSVPGWVRRILLRGLSYDPDARFESMTALLAALGNDPVIWFRRGGIVLGLAALAGAGAWQFEEAKTREAALAAEKAEEQAGREHAERQIEARQDSLTFNEAQVQIAEDPTAAVARLKKLSPESPYWEGPAHTVASQAYALGIASQVQNLPAEAMSMALSPDGRRVALRQPKRGGLALYDLETKVSKDLPARRSEIPPLVAFGPRGRQLAVQTPGIIELVDVETLEVQVVGEGRAEHNQIRFSPDGSQLFVWGNDPSVGVWDPAKKTKVDLDGHAGAVVELAVASMPGQGYRVATVDGTGAVRVWRLGDDGEVEGREVAGMGPVALCAEGSRLAVGNPNGGITLHTLDGEGEPVELAYAGDPPVSLALSSNGQELAIGTQSGEVRVLNLGDDALRSRRTHEQAVVDLAFVDQDRRLVTRGDDQSLGTWDLSSDVSRRLSGHDQVRFWTTTGAGELVTLGYEGGLRRWPLPSRVAPASVSRVRVSHLVAVTDGQRWLAADADGRAVVVSPEDGVSATQTLEDSISAVSVGVDGHSAVLGTRDGQVYAWDLTKDELVARGTTDSAVVGVQLAGGTVAAVSDKGVFVWSAAEGEAQRFEIDGSIPLSLVHHGSESWRVLGQDREGRLEIRDLGAGPAVHSLEHEGTTAFDFSADGQLLAFADLERGVHVWEDGESRRLGQHDRLVVGLAVTDDKRVVAAAGEAGAVRFWDVQGGHPRVIEVAQRGPTGVAYGGEGQTTLAWATDDGKVIWVEDPVPRGAAQLYEWVQNATGLEVELEPIDPWLEQRTEGL